MREDPKPNVVTGRDMEIIAHVDVRDRRRDAVSLLREHMTEERTDAIINALKESAKKSLPDLPVEIAARILDWLLPVRVIDAIEKALDE